jgi:DNA repair protein RadD
MTTYQLRPYQLEAVQQIRDAFGQSHRSVLFVLPTGGGKTVLFSHITEATAARGNRVCVLVHRQELLRQASASLDAMGVPHGLVAANRSMDLSQPVQVASVQTLARRLHRFPREFFRLLVVDEAHHSNAGTWAKVLEHFHRSRVLGVTATPCRCDGRGLGEWYSAMVQGPTAAWLTDNGYLAPAKVLAPPGFQVQGLRRRMGDFDMTQAAQLLEQGQAMGDCLIALPAAPERSDSDCVLLQRCARGGGGRAVQPAWRGRGIDRRNDGLCHQGAAAGGPGRRPAEGADELRVDR